ncbi:hypothetical protein HNY73_005085 [Argiope bruennichi]|uniref:Endonuclease/exonuclease/phosphatase domain-containing protein n=1 Tax=Argiope bruennichi TaxID=94029 RepID=A0A8T0FG38_ARGBR|nr:hypothetical protein HNY73_005085 [Argiope bruennichi]
MADGVLDVLYASLENHFETTDMELVSKCNMNHELREQARMPWGSSYIDITVVGTDVLDDVSYWCLPEYESLSDHNTIEFEVTATINPSTSNRFNNFLYFNVKKANWDRFDSFCKQPFVDLSNRIDSCAAVDTLISVIENFQDVVLPASKASMPLKKTRIHWVPWWSIEIECMRKRLNAARRRYQRTRNSILRNLIDRSIYK